jgi:Capsule polysaccharide biosynthesis protein
MRRRNPSQGVTGKLYMSSELLGPRNTAKSMLKAVGLLPLARRIATMLTAPPEYRNYERRFKQLRRQHVRVLAERLNDTGRKQSIALVCSPSFPEVQVELGLIKGLQLANFVPVVLITDAGRDGRLLAQHYKLAAVDSIHHWSDFARDVDKRSAAAVLDRCNSMWDLLEFEYAGVRVGRLAVSTALRGTYRGFLDVQVLEDRERLVDAVACGMASADAARKILQQFNPDLALFVDTSYSPFGELFDCCIRNNVETIQWQQAHKSNALIFKRYSLENWLEHPSSLSSESWHFVRDMKWTEDHPKQLDHELYSTYASGDWYSVVGTQFDKTIVDAARLRERLGLNPHKKTAVIFPHILWDAALFWGKCLFRDFEEWLLETVRAARENDQVNWVIKIHPANQRLRELLSFRGEPAEVTALQKHMGSLPSHISLIPPESDISSYSLFSIMDYCITVRGTIGMEAARLGIPVVTGGTGLYDNKGFTIDSETREEYLRKIRNIQSIPKLSSAQQELAERFAYANFLMRPWHATSVTLHYLQDSRNFLSQGQVNIASKEQWYAAADLRAFAEWVANPTKPGEFLAQLPQASQVAE